MDEYQKLIQQKTFEAIKFKNNKPKTFEQILNEFGIYEAI